MPSYLSSPSPSSSPMRSSRKTWARKCERACCSIATYFPLAFVYGLSTWAVWVEAGLGLQTNYKGWTGTLSPVAGVVLYLLMNWSYTTAVFTNPGSPLFPVTASGYSHLPTHETHTHRDFSSFTVKSTGEIRFCKKCNARKPDRSHHCSSCGRCVLKMDHHCPWLATCVGLRNYKPFLIFLVYTTFFCWLCFAVTGTWLWSEVFNESQYDEGLKPINFILLCAISGIFGLVLTGFTIWHLSLAYRGQTTIECLEKTRYLSPLRKTMKAQKSGMNGRLGQSYGQQLVEIHANALPGVTRPEEGESMLDDDDLEPGTRAQKSLQRDYNEMERMRERERYEDYLDEQDSEKLPSAFDLGWRRNLRHLFGTQPLLWFLPICNTSGDGWQWEHNPRWVEAREAVRKERERQWEQEEERARDRYRAKHHEQHGEPQKRPPHNDSERHYLTTSNGVLEVPGSGRRSPSKADQILGRTDEYFDSNRDEARPSSRMSMKTLRRRSSFDSSADEELDDYDISSDEDRKYGESRFDDQPKADNDWKRD